MKLRSIKYLTVEGLKNMWVNRLMSIASIAVLIACMLLMGAAIIFSLNVDKALGVLRDQSIVMVYMQDGRSEVENKATANTIRDLDNVKEATFVPQAEGLESLLDTFGEDAESLFTFVEGENPLPDAVQVKLDDLNRFDATVSAIQKVEGVDSVNSMRETAMRVNSISRLINIAGFWIIGLLIITALVIISNTIRITMNSRKLEISIMKAVGATNNFIRFPFVVEGVVLGVSAAGITMVIIYFVYKAVLGAIQESMMTQGAVPFTSFMWPLLGIFLLLGVLAGAIGSLISLGKYLRKEGSEFRAY